MMRRELELLVVLFFSVIGSSGICRADVLASLDSSGNLEVVPDFSNPFFAHNKIAITENANGDVIVLPLDNQTRVNGSLAAADFPMFDGRDIDVDLIYGSTNIVVVQDIDQTIDDLWININGTAVVDGVNVTRWSHSDSKIYASYVYLNDVGVRRDMRVYPTYDADLKDVFVLDRLFVTANSYSNTIELTDVSVDRLTVSTGSSSDDVILDNVTASSVCSISTSSGNDRVEIKPGGFSGGEFNATFQYFGGSGYGDSLVNAQYIDGSVQLSSVESVK